MKKRIYLCGILIAITVSYILGISTTMSYIYDTNTTPFDTTAHNVMYKPSISLTNQQNDHLIYGSLIGGDRIENENTINSYIYPGKQLLALQPLSPTPLRVPLTVENLSDTVTNLRVRITAQVSARDGDSVNYITFWQASSSNSASLNKWYFGKKNTQTSVFVPFMEVTFVSEATGLYRLEKLESMGSAAWEEWELQIKDGSNYTSDIPIVSTADGVGVRYPLISSVSIIIESDKEGNTPYFATLFAKRKLDLKIEYYAKQSEAMDWQPIYQNTVTYER